MHTATSFGDGLKTWRQHRRMSQLDLALEANVSARHISFLETGRARPSREMVLQLAETMGLPLKERNELLEQAGFVGAYRQTALDADTLAPIRAALDHMLKSHLPYPALICDRHWNLIDANTAAATILAPLHGNGERNMVRMVATDQARDVIVNWHDVMRDMTSRLRLELRRSGDDPLLRDLLWLIETTAPVEHPTEDAAARPFIAVEIRHGDGTLSLFSMLAEFGTPRDITVGDLRIELFFPADKSTEAALTSGLSAG